MVMTCAVGPSRCFGCPELRSVGQAPDPKVQLKASSGKVRSLSRSLNSSLGGDRPKAERKKVELAPATPEEAKEKPKRLQKGRGHKAKVKDEAEEEQVASDVGTKRSKASKKEGQTASGHRAQVTTAHELDRCPTQRWTACAFKRC